MTTYRLAPALHRAATPSLQGATVNCRNPLKGPVYPGHLVRED